jgi:hypothetical protein
MVVSGRCSNHWTWGYSWMMNVQFLHIVNVGMGGAPFKIGALIMNNEEIQRKKHETYLMIYMAKPMP